MYPKDFDKYDIAISKLMWEAFGPTEEEIERETSKTDWERIEKRFLQTCRDDQNKKLNNKNG